MAKWGLTNNYLQALQDERNQIMKSDTSAITTSHQGLLMRNYVNLPWSDWFEPRATYDFEGIFAYSYASMFRFDVCRPLYDGWSDYLHEVMCLTYHALIILPVFMLVMGERIIADFKHQEFKRLMFNILAAIMGTIGLLLLIVYSIITSLLGLVTRPGMTAILGTKDVETQSLSEKLLIQVHTALEQKNEQQLKIELNELYNHFLQNDFDKDLYIHEVNAGSEKHYRLFTAMSLLEFFIKQEKKSTPPYDDVYKKICDYNQKWSSNLGSQVNPYDLSFFSEFQTSSDIYHSQPLMGKHSFFKNDGTIVNKPVRSMLVGYWWLDKCYQVRYFSQAEKKPYKVRAVRETGRLSHNGHSLQDGQYIYIISPKGGLYMIAKDECEHFHADLGSKIHHSSIRAGQPVVCAGELQVVNGKIVSINNQSGHYCPSNEDLTAGLAILKQRGIVNEEDPLCVTGNESFTV